MKDVKVGLHKKESVKITIKNTSVVLTANQASDIGYKLILASGEANRNYLNRVVPEFYE